jgi:hypothetical protein
MMTATAMRKNLFQVLNRALQGETIEIVYKGSRLRLYALLVDPRSIVESDSALMAALSISGIGMTGPFEHRLPRCSRVHEAKLITRDRLIRQNYSNAIW